MLDLDLSVPMNQVRATIGDVDGSWISDSNINFLLVKNNNDIVLAAREALDYIISQVAYYTREETGDVEVYWHQLYEQLVKRKLQIDKETLYKRASSLFIFGGTTKSEITRVRRDQDSVGLGFNQREFLIQLDSFGIDPEDPYILIK